jgi:hypothetical protein
MAAWRKRARGGLLITPAGYVEVTNAIGLALFRGLLSLDDATNSWSWLEKDLAVGHLVKAEILWRAALQRAADLSRDYTPTLGTRSLDVLHVASALELKLPYFLAFDQRQQALAKSVGLKITRLFFD